MLGFLKRFESYVHDALAFPSLRFLGCTLDAPYQGKALTVKHAFTPGTASALVSSSHGSLGDSTERKPPRQAGPGEPAGSGPSAGVRR